MMLNTRGIDEDFAEFGMAWCSISTTVDGKKISLTALSLTTANTLRKKTCVWEQFLMRNQNV